mmetsp:Transcript_85869/g.152082  ORF Transcript_85869/g.152082 Transcript_85869/m.152082 type:complete len:350 (-) Transcript_85869:110-1159(-)
MTSVDSTPAMGQSLPDWAHPTPSPSLMARYPDPAAWGAMTLGMAGHHLPGKGQPVQPVPSATSASRLQELLFEVCSPFFKDMMAAVEAVVQQEVEARLQNAVNHDGNGYGYSQKRFSGSNPRESVTSEPLPEESSEDEDDKQSHGQTFQALFAGAKRVVEQNQKDSESSESFESAPDDAQAPGGDNPLYLTWSSEQASAKRPSLSLTPTASPLPPEMKPFVGRTAVQPQMRPGASESQGNSPTGKEDAQAARTAVVCRHWKTKGWCRMGEDCKFAHPEEKCGAGVAQAQAKKLANGQRPQAVASVTEDKKKGVKSKKPTGRSRVPTGADDASPGTHGALLTPGLVNQNG